MNKKSNRFSRVTTLLATLLVLFLAGNAYAQSPPGPGLGGLPSGSFANDVERQAALANQATYDLLDESCNPGGALDQIPDPSAPPNPSVCGGDIFFVYLTVRELIHTANELQGRGPTIASLQVDQEALGAALRWTAAEELAAQGSAASEFANSQLSNLASRMNALRFGATGFTVAGMYDPTGEMQASANHRRGGGASADDAGAAAYSPWGGFLNGSFGYGRKNDTGREDAFDFDGTEITLGVDYRFDNNVVIGGLVGYKEQAIDFDEAASQIRVVDGSIDIDGTSAIFFGLYQGERFFASGSLGLEKLDYAVDRRIKYGSNNPNLGSANSIALSSPEADVVTATLNLAYSFSRGRMTIEPYFNAEYLDITIDAFTEQRSRTAFGGQDLDAFNLRIGEQAFDTLDATLGLKFQYTFTPEFGVIVPFANIEAHNELIQDERTIFAGYGALADFTGPGGGLLNFAISTDRVDESYFTWAVGFSTVLRGGRQRTYGGPVTGGLMAFVQYESVEDLDNYDQQIISGGFRYEF